LIDLRRILVINYAAAEPDRFLDLLPPAGGLESAQPGLSRGQGRDDPDRGVGGSFREFRTAGTRCTSSR